MTGTIDRIRELFDYEDSGRLLWRKPPRARAEPHAFAGTAEPWAGYFYIKFDRRQWLLHRVVFAWHHGWLPEVVDHEDNDTTNNRIRNLRAATTQLNNFNAKGHVGLKGAHPREDGRWFARIRSNGTQKHLGSYDTEQQAHDACITAARELQGEFMWTALK